MLHASVVALRSGSRVVHSRAKRRDGDMSATAWRFVDLISSSSRPDCVIGANNWSLLWL